ncbi:hypothetical protein GCM10022402_23170 [Salinactinospora qingdaonensis]|uniref:Uncharacterized protein n=1 Tax=Salinactinospora qingdaonensis TaxID=702744 RepID=A0ABP7FLK5_9ACTN
MQVPVQTMCNVSPAVCVQWDMNLRDFSASSKSKMSVSTVRGSRSVARRRRRGGGKAPTTEGRSRGRDRSRPLAPASGPAGERSGALRLAHRRALVERRASAPSTVARPLDSSELPRAATTEDVPERRAVKDNRTPRSRMDQVAGLIWCVVTILAALSIFFS